MVKAKLVIQFEVGENVEDTNEVLEILDLGPDDVETVIKPAYKIPVSGFKKNDPADKLLSIDPGNLQFSGRRSKLTGTSKQEDIVHNVHEKPGASIEEIAEASSASVSHTRKVIASATPHEFVDEDESDAPARTNPSWYNGVIGHSEPLSSQQELSEPGEDTRTYDYLIELAKHGPGDVSDVAELSSFHEEKIDSAFPRLFKMKMADRTKNFSYGDTYTYCVSEQGEQLLRERGDLPKGGVQSHKDLRRRINS